MFGKVADYWAICGRTSVALKLYTLWGGGGYGDLA